MNRYKSACYLQRFLSVHDQIANQFMHCRYNRDAKRITQGASGQQDINWASVMTSGNFAAGLVGLVSLPYKALYKLGTPIVSNIMQKIGEIIGLNASKSKFLVGKVPDANLGIKIDVATSRYNGGSHIDLNNTNVADVVDGAIIKLAGKELFQVPKALEKTPAEAATHSLADPDQAAMFREAFARLGIEGLATKLVQGKDGLSGTKLQEKILAELTAPVDKARKWFEPGACFAKGTLVHTKEGLKPIEQIQVGDWVLSKPENGGEQAYKRVLKTFEYPPEQVIKVVYFDNFPGEKIRAGSIICTPNHPFWVETHGWTAAEDVADLFDENNPQAGNRFRLADESLASVNNVAHLFFTNDPNYAFSGGMLAGSYDASDLGYLINLKTGLVEGKKIHHPIDEIRYGDHDDPFQKLPVFNLEVEDFHTYYVGKYGIWVHNQNCGGLNFEVRNTPHALPNPEKCPASSVTSH